MKKQSPGAITKHEINLLDLINALPFNLLLADQSRRITLANASACASLGMSLDEVVGKSLSSVVPGLEQSANGYPFEAAFEKGIPVEREVFDKKSERWLSTAVYPIDTLPPKGEKSYLHWFTDITEKKTTQEELISSHQRLVILSKHLESVRETEKKKIARDLHDEISQVVNSMNVFISAALQRLPPDNSEVRTLLQRAQECSADAYEKLHQIIFELRPSILDDYGLVAALTWLSKNTLEPANIDVGFNISRKEKTLPADVRITLFRIAQESINNILKHAGAKTVLFNLIFKKNTIHMSIKDDGVGFNVEKALDAKNWPRGMGLIGMRERVVLIGGRMDIISKPNGGGTEIVIDVPVVDGPGVRSEVTDEKE